MTADRPTPDGPPTAEGVTVRELTDAADVADVVAWLDPAEAQVGVPLVHVSGRERLGRLQRTGERGTRWRSLAAQVGSRVVGYAAVVLPDSLPDDAVEAGPPLTPASVRSPLLRDLVSPADAAGLRIWMRHVADHYLDGLDGDGFVVARRPAVLGRDLTDEVEVPEVDGITVRTYEPDRDDAALDEVLAAAYEGTGDGGRTSARFAERRALPWFRPDDLLLAEDNVTGRVLGLHWLKRRDEVTGEVYNLAIHPDGQGRRLGALLLAAGFAYLHEIGCLDVVLWFDRANERAVELYAGRGFTSYWDDVALDALLT